LELNDEFFDQKATSEQSAPYFGKLAAALATSGKDIAKATVEERGLRKDLSAEVTRVKKIIELNGGNKPNFDLKEFAKENSADARKLETAAGKYIDFVNGLNDKLDAAEKTLSNFQKLVSHAEKLDDRKKIEDNVKEYDVALGVVKGTIDDKLEAGKAAQKLFKEQYQEGGDWKNLIATLDEKIKAAANSGAKLQDAGAALAKIAKA
jgi:hypothetical protein